VIENKPNQGGFYSIWGLAFILIFLFLFQLIFYFASIYVAMLVYGLGFAEVKSLLAVPDGTALAINIARLTNVITFTAYMFLPSLLFSVLNRTGIVYEGGLRVKLHARIFFLSILLLALAIPLTDYLTSALHQISMPQGLRYYAEYYEHIRNESLETILDMQRPAELVFCILAIGLLPALFEELLFRGIMLNIFKKLSRSANLAVFIQAMVFTILHLSIYEFPAILFMGILFGMIALKTGTIIYGILLHFLFNTTTIVLSYMNQQNFRKTGVNALYDSLSFGPWLSIAAFAGILILFRLLNKTVKEIHE
jgi:uncharacterized protein